MEANTIPVMPVSDGYNNGNIFMMLVFLLLAGGRGFGFGGYGGCGGAGGMINNDFLYTNLDNNLGRGFNSIQNTMNQGFTQVANQNFGLAKDMYQGFANSAQCCCETNRNIDGVRTDITGAVGQIINNNDKNTQSVLSAICDLKMSNLQNEIQKLRDDNSVLKTVQSIRNAEYSTINSLQMKAPQPAFCVPNPYTAGSCCYNQ